MSSFFPICSIIFLVADTRLYKPLFGLSVRPSVRYKVTFGGFPLLPTCPRLMLPCIWPCSQDVWALGCLLFLLCFRSHPYEDSAKLRIINAKYSIPANDSRYRIFHELIHRMFRVGKKLLPYPPRSSFFHFHYLNTAI